MFKGRLLELLQWRNSTIEDPPQRNATGVPPEHSRGGFACVLLDREHQVQWVTALHAGQCAVLSASRVRGLC